MISLTKLVDDFSEAIQRADARHPRAVGSRTGRAYQAGIGPHTESRTIELVALNPMYAAYAFDVPYPGAPRQRRCVGLGGFKQMGGDLAPLGDDLVHRLEDRGAADGERARAVGAHAIGDLGGVAVHDLDVVDGHAQTIGHHLRERRLMALPVGLRSRDDLDRSGRLHRYRYAFARRADGRFEVVRHRDATQASRVFARRVLELVKVAPARPGRPDTVAFLRAVPFGAVLAGRFVELLRVREERVRAVGGCAFEVCGTG